MSAQTGFPAQFNNPFQGPQSGPHYPMEDVETSERAHHYPNLRNSNSPSPLGNRSQEVVIDFGGNLTGNNGQANSGSDERPTNPTSTAIEGQDSNGTALQDNVTDQDMLENLFKRLITGVLKINLLYAVSFVLAVCSLKWKISYLYILVSLWLYNTYNIITLSHASTNPNGTKKWNVQGVINNLLSAIFKVFLVIQMETHALVITVPLAPLLLSEITFSLTKWHHHRKNSVGIFYKVETIFKVFVIAQALLISLKADNLIPWAWREIFWAYWVLFAIMVGITFSFLLMFISKCCAYMFAEMELFEVRGVFWLFMVTGGKTILSCILTLQVLGILQNNDNKEDLIGVLVMVPVYCGCVAMYTLMFRKEIETLFKKMAAIEEATTAEELNMIDSAKKSPKQEPEKVDIPKFLTKFSSTYFRRATGDEVQAVKDKNAKKAVTAKDNKEKVILQPTKPIKRRQNSVDYLKLKTSQLQNTTNLNLLTVQETEADRSKTTITDNWTNTSRFGLRADKGKDYFASITDRTGVSGIIPSGIITSKTDRYHTGPDINDKDRDYSPLASNDSYLLGPISKDTDTPFRPRPSKRRESKTKPSPDFTLSNTPDLSPLDIPVKKEFSMELPTFQHRRTHSMQCTPSPLQVMSLSEALGSPKVKESARAAAAIEIPDLTSPKSDASQAVQCLICFDNPPDAVFMECGHGGVCYECSLEIWKSTNECYLCRNKISQVLQLDVKSKLGNNVIKVLSSTQMVLYEEEV